MKTVFYSLCFAAFTWGAEPSCKSSEGECIFPFKYQGFTYYTCTWRGNHMTKGRPWCSTAVDKNGTHLNSKVSQGQAQTWLTCDSSCPIPSLNCSTVTDACRSQGYLQHCVETIGKTAISEWCIKAMHSTSIHATCPAECQVGIKDVGRRGRLLKPDSGTNKKSSGSSFCSADGPNKAECRIYLVTSASFLLILLVTLIIVVLYIHRRRRDSESKGYNLAIRRSSINPGDRVRTLSYAEEQSK